MGEITCVEFQDFSTNILEPLNYNSPEYQHYCNRVHQYQHFYRQLLVDPLIKRKSTQSFIVQFGELIKIPFDKLRLNYLTFKKSAPRGFQQGPRVLHILPEEDLLFVILYCESKRPGPLQ